MRNSSVLIVEDNLADQQLICDAFKRSLPDAQTFVIANGSDAIPFLQNEGKYSEVPRPDLIILDLNLPGKSGHQILSEIKTDPNFRQIPVVIFTSSSAVSDVNKVYENAGNTFFCKPPDLYEYLNVVESIQKYWLSLAQLPVSVA